MKKIRNIFFDLDNTLWDFQTNSREVLKDLFHEYNLESRCKTTAENFILTYEQVNAVLWEKLRKKEITKEQLRSNRFYNSMQQFDHDDYEMGYRMEEDYVKRSPFKKNLIPGAFETLEKLFTNYDLHIITNGFKEVQYTKMENCGIKKFFKQVIISEEIGFSKPDPKIFELAMHKANTNSAESLMIGDDLEIDVHGARNAGMHALHLNTNSTNEKKELIFEINKLPELISYLNG